MSIQLILQKHKFIQSIFYYTTAVTGLLILSSVIFSPYIPYNIHSKIGDKSPETIISPRYLQFESTIDKEKTEELRQKRRVLIDPVYSIDENINKAIKTKIISFFTILKQHKLKYSINQRTPIPNELSFLTPRALNILLKDLNINSTEYLTLQNTEKLLAHGIKEVDKEVIQSQLIENLRILDLGKKQEEVIIELTLHFLQPNLVTNKLKTEQIIDAELQSIQPFTTTLKEGQPIIYKGETVTAAHIEILRKLNMYGMKTNFYKFFGILILTTLLLFSIERYMFYFYKDKFADIKYYLLIFLVILIIVLIARVLLALVPIQRFGLGEIQYFIPISISSMLIFLFLTPQAALVVGFIVCTLTTLMFKFDFYLFIYLFLSVCASIFSLYEKHKRSEFIKSGYIVGLVNILIIIAIGLYKEIGDYLWFIENTLIGFFNGMFSSMISLAIFPYLEALFKITTPQGLLEQANLNHPLLKRLMLSAPGTYQHSLMVANLAEAAAEAIQADPILAKTGAYFHDIGKIKRPIFYIENQFGAENPHKTLSPRMSKIIIQSHIKEGMELAEKYKLPKPIQDIIAEHHGTSLVSFFYSQAIQNEDAKDIDAIKNEFRYLGPKPQSKESVIVMLADSLEAAMRSMEKPTPAKIEGLISKILKEKIDDTQLDDCPLTLHEVDTVRKTFLEFIKGIYHSRLDYEEEVAQIIEQTKNNA